MPTPIAQGKDYLSRLFAKDLAENLYPDNSFYMHAISDSHFVNGDEVILPHAGTNPNVEIDREEKAEASKRNDTHHKYNLHEFTTDPTWLQYSEELLANYNKRASILYNHSQSLNTSFANYMAIAWASAKVGAVNVLRTSGDARTSSVGTGTRKAITLDDLLAVQAQMNSDDIPQDGRFALITPQQLSDILKIEEVKSSDFNNGKPLVKGSLGQFLGITFYMRSKTVQFTSSAASIREYGATLQDTDCAGAMFWHKDFVRCAKGSNVVFLEPKKAEYYGDIMSCLVRFGGTYARKDKKGVYNLIEGTTA